MRRRADGITHLEPLLPQLAVHQVFEDAGRQHHVHRVLAVESEMFQDARGRGRPPQVHEVDARRETDGE